MSARERLSDGGWLSAVLTRGGRWAHGPIEIVRVDRIGLGYGLSGETWRLHATTAGGSVTLVAKIEDAARTTRAVTAHRHLEATMGTAVPTCHGSWVGDADGLLLLEDIAPAVQGDELEPCTSGRASDVVHAVATLHARTPSTAHPADGVERWQPPVRTTAWWGTRVVGLAARYPALLADGERARIERLLTPATDAARHLAPATSTWIHVDPHLDNVLWRPDGSPVLLDWSNSRIGPPAVDVAVLLFSLGFAEQPALSPARVLDEYFAVAPRDDDRQRLTLEASRALTVHLIGVVGWCGAPDDGPSHPRQAALRDDAIRRVLRAIDWLTTVAPGV